LENPLRDADETAMARGADRKRIRLMESTLAHLEAVESEWNEP
jgi:hypothetical protein